MRKEVVLLYSGGRDSMLSAVRLVRDGYNVHIITCQNGHIENIENARYSAQKLEDKYPGRIFVEPMIDITATMYDYLNFFARNKSIGIDLSQCICLSCRSAMLAGAIIYCKQNDVYMIATGDKDVDLYLFNCSKLKEAFTKLLEEFNIEFIHPVEYVCSNHERIVELSKNGIFPKVLEPKYWIGFEPDRSISPGEEDVALEYFYGYIEPAIKKDIKNAKGV